MPKKHGFDGVLLDLEYSGLAFDSVVSSITSFSTAFAHAAHDQQLTFYQSLYGDSVYRLRPYDLAVLGKQADGIVVMAYDFHKANGDPGPNFPLAGEAIQGYDMGTMVDDFTKKIPSQKLIVAFGLFGYDWTLNDKGNSSGAAVALSLAQIKHKFSPHCPFADCKIRRDPTSAETEITYVDSQKNKHIVWYEDMQSFAKKSAYLHTQGINATALWAYSYF